MEELMGGPAVSPILLMGDDAAEGAVGDGGRLVPMWQLANLTEHDDGDPAAGGGVGDSDSGHGGDGHEDEVGENGGEDAPVEMAQEVELVPQVNHVGKEVQYNHDSTRYEAKRGAAVNVKLRQDIKEKAKSIQLEATFADPTIRSDTVLKCCDAHSRMKQAGGYSVFEVVPQEGAYVFEYEEGKSAATVEVGPDGYVELLMRFLCVSSSVCIKAGAKKPGRIWHLVIRVTDEDGCVILEKTLRMQVMEALKDVGRFNKSKRRASKEDDQEAGSNKKRCVLPGAAPAVPPADQNDRAALLRRIVRVLGQRNPEQLATFLQALEQGRIAVVQSFV